MQIVTLNAEELRALISEAVSEALAADPAREDWMGTVETSAYLATKEAAVRDLVYRLGLPAHKAPGTNRLLFRRSEIDAWIAGGA